MKSAARFMLKLKTSKAIVPITVNMVAICIVTRQWRKGGFFLIDHTQVFLFGGLRPRARETLQIVGLDASLGLDSPYQPWSQSFTSAAAQISIVQNENGHV